MALFVHYFSNISPWFTYQFNSDDWVKEINPECSLERLMLKLNEAQVLWPPDVKGQLIGKDPDSGKDWGQEEKGMTEDEMVGFHHWLNGLEFEQISGDSERQGSLACCSPLGCNELDTIEQLNNKSRDAVLWWKRPWGRTIPTTSLPLSTFHALIINPLCFPWCPRPAWWIPCLWLPPYLPCLSSNLLLRPPFQPPFLLPVFQTSFHFIAAPDLQMADTLNIYIYLFIWLCQVIVALHRLSLVVVSGATL